MSKTCFFIEITYEAELNIDEIWPNKDGPDKPTVNDVANLIRGIGIEQVAQEWFLPGDARLYVQKIGGYR